MLREQPVIESGGAPVVGSGRAGLGRFEFTALLAMLIALSALGIDLILPAFPMIRQELGLPGDSTAVAGLITAYFIGMAIGQPIYGPLSDRFGRKPLLYAGLIVYGLGALAATFSGTLGLLLASRFLWGLGAAGPRVLTMAILRDRFEGEAMSRAMSLIMSLFILVPMVAPAVGTVGVSLGSWHWLAVGCVVVVAAIALWAMRLPETLTPANRRSLGPASLGRAFKLVVSNRQTLGYALAMMALQGGFSSYIASSEIIIDEVFGQADHFALIFAIVAGVMGLAMLVNAKMVGRIGARRLSRLALAFYIATAALMVAIGLATDGRPPMLVFLPVLALTTGAHQVVVPNANALAMGPMAAVAGMASSLIGALQLLAGALVGAAIDQAFDGTILPLSYAFLGFGILAAVLVRWADRQGATTTSR